MSLPSPRAIDKYIIAATTPYMALSLLILSAILLLQQSTKFADILGNSAAPLALSAQVALSLLPGILVFTLPMCVLVGTTTGFGKMGHDSELIAIQAAGVGTFRVVLPVLLLGMVLSLSALYVGFKVTPASARKIREIGLQAAFYRLESPVEPRSFYTGIPGKVVYVRDGDKQSGEWGRIFIHWQEQDGQTRLVTARRGRLDFSGEQTELVLGDAVITTLPAGGAEAIRRGEHVTVERSASMRVRDDRLNVSRSALERRVRDREPELDEMGWSELESKAHGASDPGARREATIALHKRLALGLTPMIFAFFGACLGLKVVRGGRSQGVTLSLAYMLLYYLVSLGGEQLGRAGTIPAVAGSWAAFAFGCLSIGLLLIKRRGGFGIHLPRLRQRHKPRGFKTDWADAKKRYHSFLGLLDRKIFLSLIRNFLLTLCTLIAIFLVFTLFELLRFIALNHVSASVITRYLLFLLPFTCMAIAPVSTLLSVLMTFALMIWRNETVAWWSSGQSAFRLILPCAFFATFLGAGMWLMQESLLPEANRTQDALRLLIRTGIMQADIQPGRDWMTSPDTGRIYTYKVGTPDSQYYDLAVFDFDPEKLHLERVTIAAKGLPVSATQIEMENVETVSLTGQSVSYANAPSMPLGAEDFQARETELNKPSELDSATLSAYIKTLNDRGGNVRPLAVALERRRSDPFSPLVMALVGAPLAFVFGRRGRIWALCVAVGTGLSFLGITNVLQQLGASGFLSVPVAVWSPLLFFLAVGLYLLSRSTT